MYDHLEFEQIFVAAALHAAVRTHGHADVVRALVAHGADLNVRTQCGSSALHMAASGGHLDAARLMLGASADVNARRRCDGDTPLHRAVGQGHAAMVSLLLQHGAKKHQQNVDGLTPMQLADTKKTRSVVDAMSAETGCPVCPPRCGWTRSGQLDEYGTCDVEVRASSLPGAGLGVFCNYKPRPMECKRFESRLLPTHSDLHQTGLHTDK